ncbi:MAG TPA: hypothetical protein DCM07_06775, partial [Planctomycetaceae bacterium]|nr:hypothetical protein [Planctomycetaceae bacterium]
GDRRIAIIDDADKMNAESANALLKTLEEPAANYLMILIASELDAILPTIRSRCQLIRFNPLTQEDISALLLGQQLVESADQALQIARLSEGSLKIASQLLDENLQALRGNITGLLGRHPFQPQAFSDAVIQAIDDIGGNTGAQRKTALWVIKFCADFYHQSLQCAAGYQADPAAGNVERFVSGLPGETEDRIETIGNLLGRMLQTEEQVNQNVTLPLCIESLSQDLREIQSK